MSGTVVLFEVIVLVIVYAVIMSTQRGLQRGGVAHLGWVRMNEGGNTAVVKQL